MYTRGRKMQFRFWQKHDYFFGQLNHSTKLGLKWAGGDREWVLIFVFYDFPSILNNNAHILHDFKTITKKRTKRNTTKIIFYEKTYFKW